MKDQNVTNYILKFDNEIANRLQQIRELIFKVAPQAQETISYGMPAYKLNKKVFIYYAGYPNHVGVYPGRVESYDFSQRVKKYASGKSTLQFKNDQPLPLDIIKELLDYRLQQMKDK